MDLGIPSRALGQDSPDPHVGGVDLHDELIVWIEMDQDGSSSEMFLELPESFLCILVPQEVNFGWR